MAKYMLLIHGDEQRWATMTPEEIARRDAGHRDFVAGAGGAIVEGNRLQDADNTTTLRGTTITDGAFLETKEVLGGYYVVEAPDLDAAIAMARKLPELAWDYNAVEVRPVWEMS
ncbi:YciI family protein [Actinoplanes sp. GCM10030250]|uniref:YciI family protein n=1 Tax=Actinoplanes sp. GCM10030250 TaxID=3273376 RepID=UPI0036130854